MSTPSVATDAALQPPLVQFDPGINYAASARCWQGIPGIERASGGRLWATWYSGGEGEGPENYVLLVSSEDDGHTWSAPRLVVDPPGQVRAFDPVLWMDPLQRLWLFWAQSEGWFDGRAGVWAIHTSAPDASTPAWSEPRRLCDGVMMNKPLALSSDEWLLPVAVWSHRDVIHPAVDEDARTSHVVASCDEGRTWTRRGGADVLGRSFDEHMLIERRDGALWMLVRLRDGIGASTSTDGGFTWSPGRKTSLTQPDSRFFIRRLNSGNLLLVKHHEYSGRSHLTALISTDDGDSWQGGLLLDERSDVSYPDGVQAADGRIFVIYDRERHGAKEILLAVFREEDVAAGQLVSDGARLKGLVNAI
jgi:hypothetical protein